MRILASAALLSALTVGSAHAMTYSLVPLQNGGAAILAQGRIEGDESGRLIAALQSAQARGVMPRTLVISSPGGVLESALDLGQTLRQAGMQTTVGALAQDAYGRVDIAGGNCHSACVMVLMAGVNRSVQPGSRVGVHSPQTQVTVRGQRYVLDDETSRRLAEPALRSYARYMGVSTKVIDVAHAVPHSSIRTLSGSEMARFGLVTSGKRQASRTRKAASRERRRA
jgi:hypothetical protein